tara:strand:+ start:932 stop:2095 length:1164 start_codon:yes stop_codon:yes gene_type:complete
MKILDCIKKENGRWYDLGIDNYFYGSTQHLTHGNIWDETTDLTSNKPWGGCTQPHYNFEMPSNIWYDIAYSNRYTIWKNIAKNDIRKHKDLFYNHIPSLDKYKNSTIVFFGGGPTTSEFLKSNKKLPLHDYTWSTNFCFLNKNMPKIDCWGPTKYLFEGILDATNNKYSWDNNPDMYNFINKDNPDIIFTEARGVAKGYISYFRKKKTTPPQWLQNFTANFSRDEGSLMENIKGEYHLKNMYPNQTTWFHPRYRSKLGVATKLIVLAIHLGVKKIYTLGIDGYTPQNEIQTIKYKGINQVEHKHSFQTNKFMPSQWKERFNLSDEEYYASMKQSYILFLEYLNNLKKDFDFELINLSEEYPEISQFGQVSKEYKQYETNLYNSRNRN